MLPTVDFSVIALSKKREDIPEQALQSVAKELVAAFSTTGFAYIVNHGVQDATVDDANELSGKFFAMPDDMKDKYHLVGNTSISHGYCKGEKTNPDRPDDCKEFFNVTPAQWKSWPDTEVAGFSQVSKDLISQCHEFSTRIFLALGLALNPQNPSIFADHHKKDHATSLNTMRYILYPSEESLEPGQISCGEHTDYGSLTLLFQGVTQGLQLMSKDGLWEDVPPVPGAVLVNTGDVMERWTAGELCSMKHRVVIPDEDTQNTNKQQRRFLAYFAHPESDTMITCIDGSEKYESVNSLDFLNSRIN